MTVRNKWNSKLYTLIQDKGSSVILQRSDGSEFEISKSEFKANYYEVKENGKRRCRDK